MKNIELCIEATKMCDRGCAHCITMADAKNATHFSPDNLEKLLLQTRDFGKVRIIFTGGGEPLLNPKIVELFDLCHKHLGKRLVEIYLATSGFLPEEKSQEDRFTRLIKKPYAPKIKLGISFNLFQENFPERLKSTMICLTKFGKDLRKRTIRMCMSCENFGETYRALAKVLDEVEILTATYIIDYLIDTYDSLFWPSLFMHKRWSKERDRWLTQEAFLYRHMVIMHNTKEKYARGLFVEPFSIEKLGRAVDIKATPFFRENPKCSFLFRKPLSSMESVCVTANGSFVPACNCLDNEGMAFGKLGEIPLQEHFRRKEILRRELLGLMLLDKRAYNLRQVCGICSFYRQAKFDF